VTVPGSHLVTTGNIVTDENNSEFRDAHVVTLAMLLRLINCRFVIHETKYTKIDNIKTTRRKL